MANPHPLYLGPRLRRLRRELGLTQLAMAEDLAISPSYIALLERNQRPVTADLLLRLARTYRLEVADLSSEDSQDFGRRLAETLRDPIFGDIDLPPLEVADVATSFPGVAQALLRLHGAYTREQEALAALRGAALPDAALDPVEEARRFFVARRNHFPGIEARAERVSEEIAAANGLDGWLGGRGVRVRVLPPEVLVGSIRRFDRHNDQLLIDETLDGASRTFQRALHVAHTAMRGEIGALVRGHGFASAAAANLVRSGLAGYGAAALLMPYRPFAVAVDRRRYDVAALARQFGVSFEQVAHRLTTLSRPGEERVPFFFLRVDEAGNVSKRLDAAGFPFAAHGGGCPLWSVHSAFRRPGEIVTQWLELPDGQRFFSIARTVRAGGGRHGQPAFYRAIALACAAEHAPRLVYADGGGDAAPTPIGVTCRLCHRTACRARSAPPIGREVLGDENRRAAEPFAFAES